MIRLSRLWLVPALLAALVSSGSAQVTQALSRRDTRLFMDPNISAVKPGQTVQLRFQLVDSKTGLPVPGKTIQAFVRDPKTRPLAATGITDAQGWATISYKAGSPWRCKEGKPAGPKTKSVKVKGVFPGDAEFDDTYGYGKVTLTKPGKCRVSD